MKQPKKLHPGRLHVRLNKTLRAAVAAYARINGVTLAQAARDAIALLPKQQKAAPKL